MSSINHDNMLGAEELERRFLQKMRAMTLEQIEDAGGLLFLLHKEVMQMRREFSEYSMEELMAHMNDGSVDRICDEYKRK